MKLGFVSAILPELSLAEVLQIAAEIGYDCVEVMCWPVGKAERRYAGVTHIDVTHFTRDQAAEIQALMRDTGVSISGLGYYPNPLCPDPAEGDVYIEHIRKVIRAAATLEIG
ncbi:MAG: sugar phosphate isomerase/epimerase, partial [Bacteroidetes bacterium]